MRGKASFLCDLIRTFADNALKFVKSTPHFMSLSIFNKKVLLKRNVRLLIVFYSYYQMNLPALQRLIETPYWKASLDCIPLSQSIWLHKEIRYRIGCVSLIDPYLIKLILVLITFSTNNIDHNDIMTRQHDEQYHSLLLYKIQNIYMDLIWKYMM